MSQDVTAAISVDEIVRLAQQLIQIPSQYIEHEIVQHREIAEFLARHMNAIGLDVQVLEEVANYPVVVGPHA